MMDKQSKIVSMFNDIAPTYDRANRVLSMGVDISWRKRACDLAFEFLGDKKLHLIADVACGTGDMMKYWAKQAEKNSVLVENIIGIDPSEGMVAVAREKLPNSTFHIAPATAIPLESSSADIVSISYGIRNVVDRVDALNEFNRVLRDGGLVVILEFMKNSSPSPLAKVRDFYLNRVLPKIGGFISKNLEAYEYLPNSIEDFLTTDAMKSELEDAGFKVLYSKSFSMDISTLIIAKKL